MLTRSLPTENSLDKLFSTAFSNILKLLNVLLNRNSAIIEKLTTFFCKGGLHYCEAGEICGCFKVKKKETG